MNPEEALSIDRDMSYREATILEPDDRATLENARMRAMVYHGANQLSLESVPVPEISEHELLVKVHACGICGTDLKKIEYGLVSPPRIFGHEIAGTIAKVGRSLRKFTVGQRVALHHHIPCQKCFFCSRKLFSQCEFYRKTGTTAGFAPAGGGFAEYVRVMDWIVERGTVLIPDDISFEEASFLEPLNTCIKALENAALEKGELVVIFGQGPVGLLMMQSAICEGAEVVGLDFMERRLELSRELGARHALHPRNGDVPATLARLSEGRGADLAIVATENPQAIRSAQQLVRRGGRVLLFAQTVPGETAPVDTSAICMEEKKLIGSYSASIELQNKAARLIFDRHLNVAKLISHRLSLDLLPQGIDLARHPSEDSLKVIIQP